ncbi:Abhydrolase domain-containing protein 2 [Portunus trituberculatus]|uniref:Abhydrolase domain-containing protein 2 n=1 Tax=Portunus trituberculatus TaxID=210409 RepID=A0A5B7JN25_PORTR|nr:Abhydrolase domain-containing protein 2 [Portunus trituberculatus]
MLPWYSRSLQFLLEWNNLARLYLFSMTENMRSVIIRHKEALLTEEVKRRYNVDERRVLSAATLPELDEVYTRWVLALSCQVDWVKVGWVGLSYPGDIVGYFCKRENDQN